jgi:hypothetical protein
VSAASPDRRVFPPIEVVVRIDRLVVETEHPVDTFDLQRGLADAVRSVVAERGLPASWDHDVRTPVSVIDGFSWDGRGGEPGLARALATRLYEDALSGEARP